MVEVDKAVKSSVVQGDASSSINWYATSRSGEKSVTTSGAQTTSTKAGLRILPHIIARHNVTIAEAQRSLQHGSGQCTKGCSPFEDVKVGLPLGTSIIGGMGKASVQLPDRTNCVVYVLGGMDRESTWVEQISKFCPQVHVFECKDKHARPMNKSFASFHPYCVGVLESDHSLASTMKQLGHTNLDILKLALDGREWEILENQIGAILPPQLLIELHAAADSKNADIAAADKGRQAVNKLLRQLSDMGYHVTGVERMTRMAKLSLVLVKEPVGKKDTVLYDNPGDCPDELSIC